MLPTAKRRGHGLKPICGCACAALLFVRGSSTSPPRSSAKKWRSLPLLPSAASQPRRRRRGLRPRPPACASPVSVSVSAGPSSPRRRPRPRSLLRPPQYLLRELLALLQKKKPRRSLTLSGFAGGQGAEEARAAARGSGNAARIRGGARPARRHRGGRRTYEACCLYSRVILYSRVVAPFVKQRRGSI